MSFFDGGVERAAVVEDAGHVYYRASSFGGCMRMLALWRQGYEPIKAGGAILDVFKAGHEAERQAWTKGWLSGRAQEQVTLVVTKRIWITGHVDSWWGHESYEVKSQSSEEWKPIRESKLWPRYSWQISVYMLATESPLTVVRVLRDKDGNISDRAEERFDEPPHSIVEVRRRVLDIEGLARRELTEAPCERVEYPCPFFYTHRQAGEVREELDDEGAAALAADYQQARVEQRAVEGRLKTARAALLSFMTERDSRRLNVKGWKLTRYKVAGKHIEYDRAEYEALRVTEPDGDEKDGGTGGSKEGAVSL